MPGVRISNRLKLRSWGRHVIGLVPFGSPPGPQQALQVGKAAGVAALLDVMKQVPATAVSVLPAFGKEGFKVPR